LTENQFKYHQYMPEKAQLEHSSNVISPMPGAVVQVFVKEGDTVVEG
jgi:biotin carboxyl carrier protein